MTLPFSPPISMSQVLTELRINDPGRNYPVSLFDADVRALAQIPSGTISMYDLLGKSVGPPSGGLQGVTIDNTLSTGHGDAGSIITTGPACTVAPIPSNASGLSYLWERVSPGGYPTCEATNTFSSSTTWFASAPTTTQPSIPETWACKVTQGATVFYSAQVTVSVTWDVEDGGG